jgi:hypothetical protein
MASYFSDFSGSRGRRETGEGSLRLHPFVQQRAPVRTPTRRKQECLDVGEAITMASMEKSASVAAMASRSPCRTACELALTADYR